MNYTQADKERLYRRVDQLSRRMVALADQRAKAVWNATCPSRTVARIDAQMRSVREDLERVQRSYRVACQDVAQGRLR